MNNLINDIKWRDLVSYERWEIVKELFLPVPWLVMSLTSAYYQFYLLSVICAFYFFLTSLRVSHNAFHYALGLPRRFTDIIMLVQSMLMLGSLHAVQCTHLLHHKHCMTNEDIEGKVAKQKIWTVLIKGPLFPLAIHYYALKYAKRNKLGWIYSEILLNAIIIISVFFVLDIFILKLHFTLMLAGYCFSAFFAVWTVHRKCAQNKYSIRTLRGKFKNLLFYNMFFHLEHHLFPGVPTCHLPQLAKRIDDAGVKSYEYVF